MKLLKKPVTEESSAHFNRTLISTKLDIPPLKSKLLCRDHLLQRFANSQESRLILISGAAASGKTSLTCQWIEKKKPAIAWYSLDTDDNDPDLFFRYLLTALSRMDETFDQVIQPWLQSQLRLCGREIIPLLVAHLAKAQEDRYLILDDYHLIVNTVLHEDVAHLLSHLPPRFHLVILTRHSLPFSISRLRVRGHLVEITTEDMRFSQRETKRFFTEIMPCNLSTQWIEEIFRQTEGWVGGVQLVGLSVKRRGGHPGLVTDAHPLNKETVEYLLDEVLDVQEERVKEFLSKTCFLDRFNVDVCREVTGFADAGDILDYIDRNNLFLVSLDHEGTWYRYHHLLSEAVRKRSIMESPAEIPAVHRKAACWFAQNGWVEDALRHAFATADLEFSADMLENLLDVFHKHQELLSGRRWIERLPQEIRRERIPLLLYECNVCMESLQAARAEGILNDIENRKDLLLARYGDAERLFFEDYIILLRGLHTYARNPLQADMEQLKGIYRELSQRNPTFAVITKIIMAGSYSYQGKINLAADTLKEVAGALAAVEDPYCTIVWLSVLATVEIWRGHLGQADALLTEAAEFLEQKGLSYTPLRLQLSKPRAWIYFYRNDLTRAADAVSEVLAYAEEADSRDIFLDSSLLTVLIHLANGHLEEVAQLLQKMRLAVPPESGWVRHIEVYSTILAMHKGDEKSVLQWVTQRQLLMDDPFSIYFPIECIVYTFHLFLSGRLQEALTMLGILKDRCLAEGFENLVLSIDIQSAVIRSALGEQERARITLEQALALAEREGNVRFFVDMAPFIVPLLKEIVDNPPRDVSPLFLATIMAACGIGNGQAGDGKNSLTVREMEILAFLAQGCKNKEIAEKAFVSIATVKTHVRHIYEKLHVQTKVQAIRRAEELKILTTGK